VAAWRRRNNRRHALGLFPEGPMMFQLAPSLAMTALLACLPAVSVPAGPPPADDEAMIDLAWDSGCFNCHDIHDQVRGPAWVKVAERYRGDDEAYERLVDTVINGGSGNWGDDSMSPNRRVPEEDVRALVEWLLTLE
jgi:cytochrome c